MLTVYLILFAALFMLVEFGKLNAPVCFYCLNFTWGKALFYFCIGLLVVFSGAHIGDEFLILWLDIVMGIYFFIIAFVFVVLHFIWKAQEATYVRNCRSH